ncbi:restriction endonuclease subunit S [Streptococcus mutans]|uniref:restriction endonuclease subunit S n=1 Tax=Streptococcus mutans TaxID=1309 RepID=UPI0027404EE5|nr:restriction endonuclease subunit S [Streptococcus mutans]MDP5864797.1 restriction endonuclease subunit S [Streptococcus mutans]
MKLGEVCDNISVTFDKTKQQVVLVNTSDVLNGKVTNHVLVNNKGLKGQFKKTFQKDDILYSEIRPKNKRFAFIDFNANDYVASTKLMVIRANKKVLPQYLYQVLKSEEVINQLQALAESRSGTFPQITFSELAQINVRIPKLDEQKEIANFLKLFDDKIENNKKINHHLEQMAQVLFEQVYYDGSSAQLGDALSTLESGSRPKGGAELDGIPSIGAENIERFGQYDYTKEKFISHEYFKRLNRGVVHSGDVLLYKDGAYTGKVSMALDGFPHAQCAVNEHIFILRPNELAPSSFFLYFLLLNSENKQALFSRASSKAAQPGLNQTEVKTLPILLPKIEKIVEFDNTIAPFMHQIAKNANENRKLSTLRDTLLPKLLSGEISVNQAAK